MFNHHYLSANEIFSISEIAPLEGMPRVANLRAIKNHDGPSINGCGIYFIQYQGRLIYIGKFLGTKSNAFTGDIFGARWCRHISTLTIRGARVSIGKTVLERFVSEEPTHVLTSILNSFDIKKLEHDRGFTVPFNRLKFVAKYWETFSESSNHWLNKFQFGYLQLSEMHWSSYSTLQIRKIINQAEKHAIQQFNPRCNAGVMFDENKLQDLGKDDIFSSLKDIFNKFSNHAIETSAQESDITTDLSSDKILVEDERDFWEERFSESLPSGCPQDTVNAIYDDLDTDFGAQVHHTQTHGGDLRVRVKDISKPQNIFTMYWQVRNEFFSCRILLPFSEVIGPGIIEARASLSDPLPSEFKVDCSIPGSIENLTGLIRKAISSARG